MLLFFSFFIIHIPYNTEVCFFLSCQPSRDGRKHFGHNQSKPLGGMDSCILEQWARQSLEVVLYFQAHELLLPLGCTSLSTSTIAMPESPLLWKERENTQSLKDFAYVLPFKIYFYAFQVFTVQLLIESL